MITKRIPFKDLNDKARNVTIHLHLDEIDFFRLFPEFHRVLSWRDSLMAETDVRTLNPEEVREFFTDLEEIILSAYGVPIDDGMGFDRDGKYHFRKMRAFNALMMEFLTDPGEANRILEALAPEGLADMVKKFEGNLDAAGKSEETPEQLRAKIQALQAQITDTQPAE